MRGVHLWGRQAGTQAVGRQAVGRQAVGTQHAIRPVAAWQSKPQPLSPRPLTKPCCASGIGRLKKLSSSLSSTTMEALSVAKYGPLACAPWLARRVCGKHEDVRQGTTCELRGRQRISLGVPSAVLLATVRPAEGWLSSIHGHAWKTTSSCTSLTPR